MMSVYVSTLLMQCCLLMYEIIIKHLNTINIEVDLFILLFSFFFFVLESYEGTGRSLSLKLLQQLEVQSQTTAKSVEGSLSGTLYFA